MSSRLRLFIAVALLPLALFAFLPMVSTGQQKNLGGKIDTDLVADGDQVSGTLTNNLGQRIRFVSLVLDSQNVAVLGDIEPGETRNVSLAVSDRGAVGYGVPNGLTQQLYSGWNSSRPEDVSRRDLLVV